MASSSLWLLPVVASFLTSLTELYSIEMEALRYLRGFTGLYWVLLSFAGFYWVLLGFTGFYWVLLGFTGFYWVLLGFPVHDGGQWFFRWPDCATLFGPWFFRISTQYSFLGRVGFSRPFHTIFTFGFGFVFVSLDCFVFRHFLSDQKLGTESQSVQCYFIEFFIWL